LYNRLISELSNPYLPLRQRNVVVGSANEETTIILTDSDVKQGKLNQLLQRKDTDVWGFKRQDTVLNTTLFKDDVKEKQSKPDLYLQIDPSKFGKIPVDMKTFLPGFVIHPIVFPGINDGMYCVEGFYTFFAMVFNMTNDGKVVFTPEMLREYVTSIILEKFNTSKNDITKRMSYNPWFAHTSKKVTDLSSDYLKEQLSSENYYPSDLDLDIIAAKLNINILILGRKTIRNPDKHWCLGKIDGAHYSIILEQNYNANGKHDVYDILLKNDSKFIFENDDFIDQARQFIAKKCKVYSLNKK
jgi:hypothetical protein